MIEKQPMEGMKPTIKQPSEDDLQLNLKCNVYDLAYAVVFGSICWLLLPL